MISRDLDSRFSDREKFAVQEWLNSNKSHHIMRDHPHHDFEVLGGLWGSKVTDENIRLRWKDILFKAFESQDFNANWWINGADQDFLKE